MEKVQVERENTIIAVRGNVAWAAYQWKLTAMVDGRGAGFRGHTTLVLEKGRERWVIVHNHTSLVNEPAAAPPQNPTP
jgi:ketosteroid isomerase-like protein